MHLSLLKKEINRLWLTDLRQSLEIKPQPGFLLKTTSLFSASLHHI